MKNPMLTMIAGLVVGLLAGLGVGLVVAPEDSAPRPGVSQQANQPIEPEAPEEPLADSEETETAPAAESLTRQEERTLQDIIAEADIPAIPTGDAAITGKVLTEEDEPVPGVEIVATSNYPESRSKSGLSTEERVRHEVRLSKWLEASERRATTDADGAYRIDGLDGDSTYRLSAEATGWRVRPEGVRRYAVLPPAECDFVATPQASVEVEVRMPDGGEPAEFTLRYRTPNQSGYRRRSSAGGSTTISLEAGTWQMYAIAGEHDEYRSDEAEVVMTHGESTATVVLKLRESPGIAGHVALPDGFSMIRPRVYLQSNPGDDIPREAFERYSGHPFASVHREKDGYGYRFTDLKDGAYRVIVVHDRRVLDRAEVQLEGDVAEVNFELQAPPAQERIGVRLFDPSGGPVDEASFSLTVHHGGGRAGFLARPWEAEDGTFWLLRPGEHGRREYEEIESFSIEVDAEGYAETTVKYEVGWTHVLDVHLERPAFLELTVPNHNDHELKDRLVWQLRTAEEGVTHHYSAWSLQNDRQHSPIELGPVEPGEYNVVLLIRIERREFACLLEQKVDLVAGENNLTTEVPPLYSLKITNGDSKRDLNVGVTNLDGPFRLRSHEAPVKNDEINLEYIPAGTYRLEGRVGEMEIRVPGRDVVEFSPRPYDCLELSIRPEGGRIESLGLRDDDKLIEIDGLELTNPSTSTTTLYGSMSSESTTWVVLRNGMRTSVTFSGVELHDILQDDDSDERLYTNPAYRD